MIGYDNKSKVLKIFFNDPATQYGLQLRQLSRLAGIAPISVKNYLKELLNEKSILAIKHPVSEYPLYYANRDNPRFRSLKRLHSIKSIYESGLLEYIDKACLPSVIILFGSAALGEDTMDSDIDLFVQSEHKNLDLVRFEDILSRKINVFYHKDFGKLSEELKNNIINGVILKGYLKVF